MKYASFLLTFICIGSISETHFLRNKNGGECDTPFEYLHQSINIDSQKNFLLMIHELYERESSRNSDKKEITAIGINIPNKGDADFQSKKSKVEQLYSRYKNEKSILLSDEEKLKLISSYYTSGDFKAATDSWLTCVTGTANFPSGVVSINEEENVEVHVKFPLNSLINSNKKVKVIGFYPPHNLVFMPEESSFKKGSNINYDNFNHVLRFKRKKGNTETGYLSIRLAKGDLVPIEIPYPRKEPSYKIVTKSETLLIKVSANVSENWFRFELPNGKIQELKYKNCKCVHYKLLLSDIRTGLDSKVVKINSYQYAPLTGGVYDFKEKGVGIEADNSVNLDVYIQTGAKRMTGNINVNYNIERLECFENCL